MSAKLPLLLVEDNEDDQFIMKRALKGAGVDNPLYLVEDGQQAIDYLSAAGKYTDREKYPLPSLLFLDLKLPIKSGLEVLEWMRSQPSLSTIVIVILTASEHPADIKAGYRLGANSYLVKPPTTDELVQMAKSFKWYWLEFNRFARALS